MQILKFALYGRVGVFKKWYTASSVLTYDFPPPTVIFGVIGATLGLRKSVVINEENDYLKQMNEKKVRIALNIHKPIRKVRFNINFINTKTNWILEKNEHTQIRVEAVYNPYYIVYVSADDNEFLQSLKYRLIKHSSYYTISLGWANFLANIKFIATLNGELIENNTEQIYLNNVVPLSVVKESVLIEADDFLGKEIVPTKMDKYRNAQVYSKVLYKSSWGKNKYIKARPKNFIKLEDENIIFVN